MSSIVYQWMKTYVPKEIINCPDEASLFIKDVNLNCTNLRLSLVLQNNGRFNLGGYFIRATNDSNQELATIDLSQFLDKNATNGAKIEGNLIMFNKYKFGENSLEPNSAAVTHIFNLDNLIYSIEIIPIRYQLENNKNRIVSCGNSKIKEYIKCD